MILLHNHHYMGINPIYKEVYMFNILKRHKIVIIVILTDLFLFWLTFYSDIILTFINPSIEDYSISDTSFPRNYAEVLFWYLVHMPSSIVLENILGHIVESKVYLSLSIIQTDLIAYFIENHINYKMISKTRL
jgi:hypothetical protein